MLFAFLWLAFIGPARAQGVAAADGGKYALLVGVREYNNGKLPDLRYTENDVEDLAKILADRKSAGFEVTVLTSSRGKANAADRPTAINVRAALRQLLKHRTKHDTVLVALAGHGVQMNVAGRDGKSHEEAFFCPSDARLDDPASLISLNDLFQTLDDSNVGVKLLLVDACRNDPKEGRSLDVDTVPRPPRGIAALFSCSAGQRAFETDKLGKGHGVFFHFVLEGLRGSARNEDGAVTWGRLTEYVTTRVAAEVPVLIGDGARQEPHQVTNLTGQAPVLVGRAQAGAAGQARETGGKSFPRAAAPVARETGGDKSFPRQALVGCWELVHHTSPKIQPGATFDVFNDGKMTVTIPAAGGERKGDYNWMLSGDQLTLSPRQGNSGQEVRTRILKLNPAELVVEDVTGTSVFKRLTINPNLLGTWELVQPNRKLSFQMVIRPNRTITTTLRAPRATISTVGAYKVEGTQVWTTIKTADNRVERHVTTIKKLTDRELVIQRQDGNVQVYLRR